MAVLENGVRVVVPETAYQDGRQIGYKTAGLTLSTEYTNYTGADIYIKSQNNLGFVVEPNTKTASVEEPRPHVEIKFIYTIHNNDGILGTMQLMSAMDQNGMLLGLDAEALQKRLTDLYMRDASRGNKMNFSFVIYKRVLDDELRRSKTVYVRECDLIVCKDKSSMMVPHPNSNEGMQQTEVTVNRNYYGQAGIFVKVIDNQHLAKIRYYHGGKNLISVPSIVDESKESGVYCTISTMASDGLVTPTSRFLTFEEAEEAIGLYRTKEEALSHGDPEIALRAEEARNKAEEAKGKVEERRLARELTEVKHRAEMEAIRREEELNQLKQSLEIYRGENTRLKESIDVRKSVRDDSYDVVKKHRDDEFDQTKKYREDYYETRDRRRKDYYEDRSYERKDSSEMIKFIPAFLLGIAGAVAFIRTQNS